MSRKRIIWLLVLVVIAGGAYYGYMEYNRTNKDLSKVKPDIITTAPDIIKEFQDNDTAANKKFLGKIVELSGNVKKLEKDEQGDYTVVLGDAFSLSSVRCLSDSNHRNEFSVIKENSTITIRGACTGFKKNEEMLGMDLGSDVELNRAVIVGNKN
jgi:tRNA_anti-like